MSSKWTANEGDFTIDGFEVYSGPERSEEWRDDSTFPKLADLTIPEGAQHKLSMWRTGRKVGRTIYAQIGDTPSDADPLIGMMDSSLLAADAVHAHNIQVAAQLKAAR